MQRCHSLKGGVAFGVVGPTIQMQCYRWYGVSCLKNVVLYMRCCQPYICGITCGAVLSALQTLCYMRCGIAILANVGLHAVWCCKTY